MYREGFLEVVSCGTSQKGNGHVTRCPAVLLTEGSLLVTALCWGGLEGPEVALLGVVETGTCVCGARGKGRPGTWSLGGTSLYVTLVQLCALELSGDSWTPRVVAARLVSV